MKNVFTCDEVVNLFEHQVAHRFHPFTCPNRGDGNHRFVLSDLGALVPTVRGWICPFCDYTQDWAHDFMKKEFKHEDADDARSAVDLVFGFDRRA